MAGTAGKKAVKDFIALVSAKNSDTLHAVRDTALEHMAKGISLVCVFGLTTEERYAIYQCELFKRGEG
jgi:hypothetical protein